MMIKNPEYKQLAVDSSNGMIRYDAEWVQGNCVEAAYAMCEAGRLRAKMARMSIEAGDFARAAADWLSSASCYVRIGDARKAGASLSQAQQIEQAGNVPTSRADLLDALREREAELRKLNLKQDAFFKSVERRGRSWLIADRRVLSILRQRLEDFPGWDVLHAMIAFQAEKLGDTELAGKHRQWAIRFAASPSVDAYYQINRLIQQRQFDQAADSARAFLACNPDEPGLVPALLSIAMFSISPTPAGCRQAIQLLLPFAAADRYDLRTRIMAIAYVTFFWWRLGNLQEFTRSQSALRELEMSENGSLRPGGRYSDLIASLPQPMPETAQGQLELPAEAVEKLGTLSAVRLTAA